MKIAALSRCWREGVLALVALLAFVGLLSLDPIRQPLAYHDFADKRIFLGIPNFANVVSNIPFFVIGVMGLAWCFTPPKTGASASWAVFFVGVVLVCFGSGYYHATPENATLVWDRLPMTLAFMGLFVALLVEHLNDSLGRYLLPPALVVGLASVGWWSYADDLRFYVWVQCLPLLTIPLVLVLFPATYTHRSYLLYGLGFYALAKIAESYDRELFALTANTFSGHSMKHVLAALGPFFVYLMLKRRKLANRPPP